MNITRITKASFAVIGKEGSTLDGEGFIQRLWEDANTHFEEVEHLARRDEKGRIIGIWGAMTDFSRRFQPWEDGFSRGLYLAGVECEEDVSAPQGWSKWVVPGFEYLCAECDRDTLFPDILQYLTENNMSLVGAVHDYTCPISGKTYMFFPIRRL